MYRFYENVADRIPRSVFTSNKRLSLSALKELKKNYPEGRVEFVEGGSYQGSQYEDKDLPLVDGTILRFRDGTLSILQASTEKPVIVSAEVNPFLLNHPDRRVVSVYLEYLSFYLFGLHYTAPREFDLMTFMTGKESPSFYIETKDYTAQREDFLGGSVVDGILKLEYVRDGINIFLDVKVGSDDEVEPLLELWISTHTARVIHPEDRFPWLVLNP